MINLDNAATTGRKPECVIDAVTEAMHHLNINAGRGSYEAARKAAALIDECKARMLSIAGIHDGYSCYFSPSATHALNGLLLGLPCDRFTHFYVSPFEHNAVMRPLTAVCKKSNAAWHQLPFQYETWAFSVEEAEAMFLHEKPDYVLISAVSNTTGLSLPLKEIVQLAHAYDAKVIVDCAQAMGSIVLNGGEICADAYVFAGHKTLYGPFGIAGFLLSDGWKLPFSIFGGTGTDSLNLDMPSPSAGGYEPSSPNITAISGLNAALNWIEQTGIEAIQAHEKNLVNQLTYRLQALDRVILYTPPEAQRSSIVAFNIEGYESHEVGEILDEEFGICVRTGYQCAPLVHDWLGTKPFGGIVRASVSFFSTEEEIDAFMKAVGTL